MISSQGVKTTNNQSRLIMHNNSAGSQMLTVQTQKVRTNTFNQSDLGEIFNTCKWLAGDFQEIII